ncbi:MAG: hypothetical protein V3V33_02515 [Candidatus Lokiarchaeia archaeon]
MKVIKKKNLNIILLISIIIPLFLSVPNNTLNYENVSIKRAGWSSNADWHEEDNKSTAEVDVVYREVLGVDGHSGLDMLEQRMDINYKDGTGANAGFVTRLKFNDGGVGGGVVDDWSKISGTEPTFYSGSIISNQTVGADYKFNGFGIYKGNSSNIALLNHTVGEGWDLKLDESEKVGEIDVLTKNYKVGAVTLSTNEVLYGGNMVTQSVAEFDIIVNATIGNTTHTHDIQVIYKFEVRHMINETRYKFGVDIDWTGIEDFPTELNMNSGDEYLLVANDRLGVGIDKFPINTFYSNAENDTAIFKFEDEEICRQYFTTAFKINLTGSDTSTSRLYLQNASYHSPGGYMSRVYVFFDGFRYGQSNGIRYDPLVVVPCDYTPLPNGDNGDPIPNDDNFISFGNLFLGFFTISIIALVIIVKKRKKQ